MRPALLHDNPFVVDESFEFHRLPSKTLISLTSKALKEAGNSHSAQLREQAMITTLLDELHESSLVESLIDDLEEPSDEAVDSLNSKVPSDSTTSLLQLEKAHRDRDKARAFRNACLRRIEFAQSKESLLDKLAQSVEDSRSSALAYVRSLTSLHPNLIEIQLRLKDGTLIPTEVPLELRPDSVAARIDELKSEIHSLRLKAAVIRRGHGEAKTQQSDRRKEASIAEARLIQARKRLSQEQKRDAAESAIANKTEQELLKEVMDLAQEETELERRFDIAYSAFNHQKKVVTNLEEQASMLVPPETRIASMIRVVDVDPVIMALEELIEFFEKRVQLDGRIIVANQLLIDRGKPLEAEASVSIDHLFRMNVTVARAQRLVSKPSEIPPLADPQHLAAVALRIDDSLTEVRVASDRAMTRDVRFLQGQTDPAIGEIKKLLSDLYAIRNAKTNAMTVEQEIQGINPQEAKDSFSRSFREFESLNATLKTKRERVVEIGDAVQKASDRLEDVKIKFAQASAEHAKIIERQLMNAIKREGVLDRLPTFDSPLAIGNVVPTNAENETNSPSYPGASEAHAVPTRFDGAPLSLFEFQRLIADHDRILNDQQILAVALATAISDKSSALQSLFETLNKLQSLADILHLRAIDLRKRIGVDGLNQTSIDGLQESLRQERLQDLDFEVIKTLHLRTQLRQQQRTLDIFLIANKTTWTLTSELLKIVNKRIEVLDDLRQLETDFKKEKADRDPAELKRLKQKAIDQRSSKSSLTETVLGLVNFEKVTASSDSLDAYYEELIELNEKHDIIQREIEQLDQLRLITSRQTEILQTSSPRLRETISEIRFVQEDDFVATRAALQADLAFEILRRYFVRSGRLLPKPVPYAGRDREIKTKETVGLLLSWQLQIEALERLQDELEAQIDTQENRKYLAENEDQSTRLRSIQIRNRRRIHELTGEAPAGKIQTGEDDGVEKEMKLVDPDGLIGRQRRQMVRIGSQVIQNIAITIVLLILVGCFLPTIVAWLLQVTLGRIANDSRSPLLLTSLQGFVRVVIWMLVCAMILTTIGVDVSAILAGLGIGGLAIGLAAQPMISDTIAALVIFVERRFTIGDVIKIGENEPAMVVGLTWRSTQLKNADGMMYSLPNRNVTEETIQKLTHGGKTFDFVDATMITQHDPEMVLQVVREAMDGLTNLAPQAERGTRIKEIEMTGDVKTVIYRIWWYLQDYNLRNQTRDEMFAKVSNRLSEPDMQGTEIKFA